MKVLLIAFLTFCVELAWMGFCVVEMFHTRYKTEFLSIFFMWILGGMIIAALYVALMYVIDLIGE